jgi:hypothetical protein
MKKMFTICPELFVLTPVKIIEPACNTQNYNRGKRINYESNDDMLFNGRPQVYRGDCRVNADRSMISICFKSFEIHGSYHMNLKDVFYTSLHPVITTGKSFTITYLPVCN